MRTKGTEENDSKGGIAVQGARAYRRHAFTFHASMRHRPSMGTAMMDWTIDTEEGESWRSRFGSKSGPRWSAEIQTSFSDAI